jgi:hypothetical protein
MKLRFYNNDALNKGMKLVRKREKLIAKKEDIKNNGVKWYVVLYYIFKHPIKMIKAISRSD